MLRLFSWNVNGIRAVAKKGELEKFFEAYQPDIVGFQEIKANAEQLKLPWLVGYQEFINPAKRKGYSGTAVYSKIPPLTVSYNLPDDLAKKVGLTDAYGDVNTEGRVVTAEFEQFFFVTVYTPNSKGDLSRLDLRQRQWDPLFLTYLQQLEQTKPVIVCGDFNVAHQEIDLANPRANVGKHGFTSAERQGFTNYITAGLVDSLRKFNSQPQQYTWWSHFAKSRQRNIGWRIDYFLVSKALSAHLKSAKIHPEQLGSDHCPISIEIEV